MKTATAINGILVLFVVAIYGMIVYQFYQWMDAGDSETVARLESDAPATQRNDERYVYEADVRDPFQYRVAVKWRSGKKASTGTTTLIAPQLKLAGIVMTGKRRTALLEAPDGSAYVVEEGDTLPKVKILRIKDRSITYTYSKKLNNLTLKDD